MTLFATHYHELVKLDKNFKGIINFHLLTRSSGDGVVFLRKIKEGFATKSYGVEVAHIAGLPSTVLQRATQILKDLEKNIKIQPEQTFVAPTSVPSKDKIREILKDLELEKMTPIEALNILEQLKNELYD